MTRNSNAITLAKRFYEEGVHSIFDFKKYVLKTRYQMHRMGV